MVETRKMPCPFCGEDVDCLYTPRTLVTRYARAASNKKAMNYYKDERFVPTGACPGCAAGPSEIASMLRKSPSLKASEAAKRAKEAGLPTTI